MECKKKTKDAEPNFFILLVNFYDWMSGVKVTAATAFYFPTKKNHLRISPIIKDH